MATYIITDTLAVDWDTINWGNMPQFKYLRESTDGHPTAEAEFTLRQEAGLPAVLWALDQPRSESHILRQCNG